MVGDAVLVISDEHDVVVPGGFVDHLFPHERIQHLAVNAALLQEVGVDAVHCVVSLRK